MSLKVILRLVAFAALICDGSCNCVGNGNSGHGNGGTQNGGSLTVIISYETDVPCTDHFFGNQLNTAAFQKLEKCNIKWIIEPCYHSHINKDTHKLECVEGGEPQCELDRVHACAGKLNENKGNEFGIFVSCTLGSGDIKTSGPRCAQLAKFDWNKINECVQNGNGDKYCDAYHQTIMARKPVWIPSIEYDGKYEEDLQLKSKMNFMSVLCAKIKAKGMSCDACNTSPQGDD